MKTEAQDISESELAVRAKAGSLEAFERLVFLHQARIYNFVLQRCGRPEDAQEITQDTFVKAYQALAQFDASRAFGPWLFTIARRKCIDWFRTGAQSISSAVPEQADMNTPSDALAQVEESERLWLLARRLLPPSQYETLWLRYVEDMTVEEISAVVRKTKTHVKILLFRSRRILARHLRTAPKGDVIAVSTRLAEPTKIPRTIL